MNKKIVVIIVTAAILASVHLAEGQKPAKVRKIGFLTATTGPPATSYEIFRQALRERGYVEGQNIVFEYRAVENSSRLAEVATELAQLKVDVIVTTGGATRRAKMATGAVPIVFSYSGDPVEAGFVKSIARPGGNMTGITWLAFELVGKRLELLKEVVPTVSRVAVLANPAHPGEQRELAETQSTARTLGTTLQYHQVRATPDFARGVRRDRQGKCQCSSCLPGSHNLAAQQADCGVRGKAPDSQHVRMEGVYRSWRSCGVRARPRRVGKAPCRVR